VAQSCASALEHFAVNNTRVYTHSDLNATAAVQVYCSNGVGLGGDGSSRDRVSSSCGAALVLFNVTEAKAYVHPEVNASAAVQVQCVNGTSLGGDGSSVQASSTSCAVLSRRWGLTNGMFHVNGTLRYGFHSVFVVM
jgi:hypothetical protein